MTIKDKQVLIYDTTLRDGTQGEGVSFSVASKLRLTEKFDQFGIDYIEGGWPGSNERDMAYFREVKHLKLKHAKIAAFGSTRRAKLPVAEDPQVALLLDAETPVVTIFGKTWLLHVTDVLKVKPEDNLAMIQDTVAHLKAAGREVIYDAEHFFDGYKDNPEYALKTLEAAFKGGADCLTLCDTNGGTMVHEFDQITADVVSRFGERPVGLHCHNDSGVGVAVSLAGVRAGGKLVQATMNGFGERNGNANLITILPNLALKLGYDMNCARNMKNLRDLSLFVDEMANIRSDIRAPFVGATSFAHKGGVHADAVNKVKHSYEHIEPELVGNRTRVLVSDMSGRASVMMKAREIGYDVDPKDPKMKSLLEELKQLEFRGYEYEAADASFRLLLSRLLENKEEIFELLSYRVIVERDEERDEMVSEATVKMRIGDTIQHVVDEAHGPVGALDGALRKALEIAYPQINDLKLTDFKVRILDSTDGADARIRVQVETTDGENIWGTVGASDNIIEASWLALKDAVEYKLMKDNK